MATLVEGDPKTPFSIGTTQWNRGVLHFTLFPYLIMLSVKQGGIKYYFLSLWYDSIWDWIVVSRAIGEHSTNNTNGSVKLVTLVEEDPKAPFPIATTQKCRRGRYSIPWIAPLYPWSLPHNGVCWAKRHQVPFFESFV